MNERIRELAEQAKISATKNGKYNLVVVMPEFEQKFAELIEQDCIDKFIKVWYKQGLDVRGAELDKFMLCYEELHSK